MNRDKHIVFFTIIVDRKKKDDIVSLLMKSGARVINTVYGKGSVKAGMMKNVFGFVPEENKIIATCLLLGEKSDALIDTLNKDFNFDKPNTGIAFSIPIEGLSF